MPEIVATEMLVKLLERMPGMFWASRTDPTTGQSEWLYASPRLAKVYGLTDEAMRKDPNALLVNVVPEDRDQIVRMLAETAQSLAPIEWTGRVDAGDGRHRWVEVSMMQSREDDGAMVYCGQVTDVTQRKQTELALAESEAARARADEFHRQVIDALPIGIMVANQANEFVVFNPAHQRVVGGITQMQAGDVSNAYGLFMPDGVTPLPTQNTGMARALRGEQLDEEVVVKNPRLAAPVRIRVAWTPLRDASGAVTAAVGASTDITLQRELEDELRTRNEQLAASEEAKSALIERLRHAIDELSNPILEVWDGVLAMPLIGVVDSRRTADMVQRLLAEVSQSQANFVIVDLTGVDIVDTRTADHLIKLMRKVEVVGARCVLTGIRPAVAGTLVDIGVDFGGVRTFRNLKHGLRAALRVGRRERDDLRDVAADEDDDELDLLEDAAPRRRR